MKFIKNLATTLAFVVSFISVVLPISGAQANTEEGQHHAKLVQNFEQKLGLKIMSVSDAKVPGLVQLNTSTGIFYGSEDGEFFLNARIYRVGDELVDETGEAMQKYRLEGVERFKESAIEFTAEKEKYVINVFTDATCGYCRKLHNEMDILNDLGITVRYLAFPRQGINSQVYRDAVSIWCAKDPQEAMTKAKSGVNVLDTNCANKVADQYNFGKASGVNSTPNIILPDGSLIKGYQPAQALLLTLQAAEKA